MNKIKAHKIKSILSRINLIKNKIPFHDWESVGWCDDDVCGRDGCEGSIIHDDNPCSCHMGNPPCGACENRKHYCSDCDWNELDNWEEERYLVEQIEDRVSENHTFTVEDIKYLNRINRII